RIWNVGMFTGTALVPNGMPGGVRGTGNNRPYSIIFRLTRVVSLHRHSKQSFFFHKRDHQKCSFAIILAI
ncbi:MAG: hypothetical protein K1W12_08400, partial [Turicimonas muris]